MIKKITNRNLKKAGHFAILAEKLIGQCIRKKDFPHNAGRLTTQTKHTAVAIKTTKTITIEIRVHYI